MKRTFWTLCAFMLSQIPYVILVDECSFRGQRLTEKQYNITTCTQCYVYLSFEKSVFYPVMDFDNVSLCLLKADGTSYVCPETGNQQSLDTVCNTLTGVSDCSDFTKCCSSAWDCCQTQKQRRKQDPQTGACPQTWDGWACWNFTNAGTVVTQKCPSFIEYIDTNALVTKQCTSNGSWFVDTETGLEWSDYTQCTPEYYTSLLKLYKDESVVALAFNSFGICLLIPAIGIFLRYKPLRRQQRIKIHLNLFTSLLVSGLINLCWDILVNYDRIQNDDAHSFLRGDQAWCKALNILEQFGRACPFFWMLCEGVYLHRLLVKAFKPPKYLIGFYICGWGVPAVLSLIYALLKNFLADDNICWVELTSGTRNGVEWILSAATILCLTINLILLLNIIRILIKQLVKSPREPSNFRKALKATLILMPLLGLHQFFLIYSVKTDEDGYFVFRIVLAIVTNSQGIIISLIFCYCNGEVLSLIKNSWRIRRSSAYKGESRKSITYQSNIRRLSNTSTDTQNGRLPRRNSSDGFLNINGGTRLGKNDNNDNNIQLSVIEEHSNGYVNSAFSEDCAT